jgi:LmbE family N-acetylglucosaminyl deacetylase
MQNERKVLVIIAHPDDEIFVAGTICLCVEKSFKVELVCATDGEGGGGELVCESSGLSLAEVRRRELSLSAAVLGISKVSFLNQPDVAEPQRPGTVTWDQPKIVDALVQQIKEATPELVLTHGPLGGYGHPAHQLLHYCVMAAVEAASFSGSVFSFCGKVPGAFFSWHFDEPSNVLIDVRRFRARRIASLSYHQSQISFFVQPRMPRTFRKFLSVLFGTVFSWTEVGRKRVPLGTPERFIRRFPREGLVSQKLPDDGKPHFFAQYYSNENKISFCH